MSWLASKWQQVVQACGLWELEHKSWDTTDINARHVGAKFYGNSLGLP